MQVTGLFPACDVCGHRECYPAFPGDVRPEGITGSRNGSRWGIWGAAMQITVIGCRNGSQWGIWGPANQTTPAAAAAAEWLVVDAEGCVCIGMRCQQSGLESSKEVVIMVAGLEGGVVEGT